MKIIKVSDTELNQNPHHIDTKKLYDENLAQVVHILLKPSEKLKKHITPVDVLFYVLEGTGIIEIAGEKMEVTKDSLIESPAKTPYCWYNETDANFKSFGSENSKTRRINKIIIKQIT